MFFEKLGLPVCVTNDFGFPISPSYPEYDKGTIHFASDLIPQAKNFTGNIDWDEEIGFDGDGYKPPKFGFGDAIKAIKVVGKIVKTVDGFVEKLDGDGFGGGAVGGGISGISSALSAFSTVSSVVGTIMPAIGMVTSIVSLVGGLFGGGGGENSAMQEFMDAIMEGFKQINERIDELDRSIGKHFNQLKKFHANLYLDNEFAILQRIKYAYLDYMKLANLVDHVDFLSLKEKYTENFRYACNNLDFTPADIIRNIYGHACGDADFSKRCGTGAQFFQNGENSGECVYGQKKQGYLFDLFWSSFQSLDEFRTFRNAVIGSLREALFLQSVCLPPITSLCHIHNDPIFLDALNNSISALAEVENNFASIEKCFCPCKYLDFNIRMGGDSYHKVELSSFSANIEWAESIGLDDMPRTFLSYPIDIGKMNALRESEMDYQLHKLFDRLPRYNKNTESKLSDLFRNATVDLLGWSNGPSERPQVGMPVDLIQKLSLKIFEAEFANTYFHHRDDRSYVRGWYGDLYAGSASASDIFDIDESNHLLCHSYTAPWVGMGHGFRFQVVVHPTRECGIPPDGKEFCWENKPDCEEGFFCNSTSHRCTRNPALFEPCVIDGMEIHCDEGECVMNEDNSTDAKICKKVCGNENSSCPSFTYCEGTYCEEKKPNSSSCLKNFECKEDSFCSSNSTCTGRLALGEVCSSSNECSLGSRCELNVTYVNSTETENGETTEDSIYICTSVLGEACDSDEDCLTFTFYCKNETCVEKEISGEPCFQKRDDSCASNFCDPTTNTCT